MALGTSWMTGQVSVMLTLWPGWSRLPDLFSLHSERHHVPCFLQQQEPALHQHLARGLPKGSFRNVYPLLYLSRGWSQTVSEGSVEHLLSIRVQIPRSKTNWLCEVDSTVQGQASWEDAGMAGATCID